MKSGSGSESQASRWTPVIILDITHRSEPVSFRLWWSETHGRQAELTHWARCLRLSGCGHSFPSIGISVINTTGSCRSLPFGIT